MAQQAVFMQRITQLEGRLALNSKNSSNSPSRSPHRRMRT
ncbi:DUF6444 domain-containing protein [Polaromonas sp.]